MYIEPTKSFTRVVYSPEEVRSLGIQGEMIDAKWGRHAADTGLKTGNRLEISLVATGKKVALEVGDQIATAGTVRTFSSMTFEHYVLEGIVEKAEASGYTMKVHKIIRTDEIPMAFVGRVPVQVRESTSVQIKIEGTGQLSLPWLGQLRGVSDFLPLELRQIRRMNGGRIAEIVVGAPVSQRGQPMEVLAIMRAPSGR